MALKSVLKSAKGPKRTQYQTTDLIAVTHFAKARSRNTGSLHSRSPTHCAAFHVGIMSA
jgi:hypothetical protein